jgi:CheY-like chemotaxis protein
LSDRRKSPGLHELAAARPEPTPDPEAGVTVLLAEDEPAVRALVSRTLAKAGYHVVAARDGQEALERATGLEALSVLVTDLAMPRMGGLELRTRLHAEHPELPVLFISGHVQDGLAGLMPEDSILEKPFRSQELLARVRDLLA